MQYIGIPEKNWFWLLESKSVVSIRSETPKAAVWHLDAGLKPGARPEDQHFIYSQKQLILAASKVRQWDFPEQLPALPSLFALSWLPCRQAILQEGICFYRLDLTQLEALCY